MPGLREFLDDFFAKGPVPFGAFMQAALYDAEFGYYARHIRDVGRRGDFSTGVSLSPVLGDAVAHWIEAELDHFGCDHAHLVELGPGDGSLMRLVLDAAPGRLRRRLQIHLVEVSEPLREIQRQTLAGRHRRRIRWHPSIDGVMRHASGESSLPVLCFSNEFVDAFPVRIFRAIDGRELHLACEDGRLAETWLPPIHPVDSTLFAHAFPADQRLEVHDTYRRWLRDWAPSLPAGSLLTIDYGGPVESLYHRRPHGTLRAYYRHQRLEGSDVYARFGKQDLTADVNFTDLIRWGEEAGLETVSLVPQREFLLPFVRPNSDADAYLADPHGPGGAFHVLHQRKEPMDPPETT